MDVKKGNGISREAMDAVLPSVVPTVDQAAGTLTEQESTLLLVAKMIFPDLFPGVINDPEEKWAYAMSTLLVNLLRQWPAHQRRRLADNLMMRGDLALEAVLEERGRIEGQFGEQNLTPLEWLGILTEEVGEVAQAANDRYWRKGDAAPGLRKELVQVAAVALQAIEDCDRNGWMREDCEIGRKEKAS